MLSMFGQFSKTLMTEPKPNRKFDRSSIDHELRPISTDGGCSYQACTTRHGVQRGVQVLRSIQCMHSLYFSKYFSKFKSL